VRSSLGAYPENARDRAHVRQRPGLASLPSTLVAGPAWPSLPGLVLAACLATAAAAATGCARIEFVSPDGASAPTWHGPSPVDLDETGDATSASFYLTLNDATSLRDGTDVSHGAFETAATSTHGALVASLYDGTNLRPFGRVYTPYSQGGEGWAVHGQSEQAAFLDASASNDALYVSLGFNSSGIGFALYSDGTSTAYTGNAQLTSGDWVWDEVSAQIGATLSAGTLPGRGYLPNATDGFIANGQPNSTAWDESGHAYYGFVDQRVPQHFAGYVSTYTAFTSWSTGNGLRLGPLTSQLKLLNDGYGVVPVWVGQDSLTASTLDFGTNHGCAITAQGVRCWGSNANGQGGSPLTSSTLTFPAAVDGMGGTVVSIDGGTAHTCAVTQAASVLCWGVNDAGQMGSGAIGAEQTSPLAVSGITGTPREIASGTSHSCARTSAGSVFCWGDNASGQLGDAGAAVGPSVPVAASALTTATQITAGDNHACALVAAGTVFCWGEGDTGQIGDNGSVDRNVPTQVAGLANVTQIAAGSNHTCAVTSAGTVFCWGLGTSGQLGNGAVVAEEPAPVQVTGLTNATRVVAGLAHSCAITSANLAFCWGENGSGQLGDTTTVDSANAVQVSLPTGPTLSSISASANVSAVVTSQGQVLCWGSNASGQCHGDNALVSTGVPLEIAASADQAVRATASTDSFAQFATLSTGDVKAMSAATDGAGNVVVTFLQVDPDFVTAPTGTISTPYVVRGNDVRVFAAMRGADGTWTGPTRLDDASKFSSDTTTVFQDAWGRASNSLANITGGIEYATPVVSYIGEGRFLAAFALTNLVASRSAIYVRGFTVGTGWDPASQIFVLDALNLDSSTTLEAYRYANDLFMTGNGQGDALLVAHVVVPSDDGSDVTLHNYGMKAFVYSRDQGGWRPDAQQLIPSSICRASADWPAAIGDPFRCWGLKPHGMIFPGAEAVVVFPAPAGTSDTDATRLRLYSTEFRQ
jgi:alpha-tubulin suppressor-like RCC1 family protein